MFRDRAGKGIEFNYRAVEEQLASDPRLPSSDYSYITEQGIGASYMAPGLGRMYENFHNPFLVQEAIQRELEKERIREEIIAKEIVRRRVLEAEVRREMMLERESALQGRGCNEYGRISFLQGMRSELSNHSLGQAEGRSLEERIAMSLEERFRYRERREIGGCEIVPFEEINLEPKRGNNKMFPSQWRAAEPKISEVALTSEVGKEKEQIVFLARPESNLSGEKRKSVMPPQEGKMELPLSGGIKKKVKEEWSCAICQVSATSERGLDEHIQGKKHRSKEAALSAQRKGNNIGIGIHPKRAAKPTMFRNWTNNSSSEQRQKSGFQLLKAEQTGKSSLQIIPIESAPKEKNVSSAEVVQEAGNSNNEVLEVDGQKKLANKEKKFKLWCEMCRVGAYSETVMEAHRTGKKHVMRLEGSMKNRSVLTPQMDSTEIKNADEPTKDVSHDRSQNIT